MNLLEPGTGAYPIPHGLQNHATFEVPGLVNCHKPLVTFRVRPKIRIPFAYL
jgi:hypothetical protein